jgi:hypothetical protein
MGGVTVTMAGLSGRDRDDGMLCSEAGLVGLEESLAPAAGEEARVQPCGSALLAAWRANCTCGIAYWMSVKRERG